MPSEITMPQLSDTMTEGTVVKWHKKEGDAVKAGEEIADIETDKATMPMEAFEAGTLAVIAAPEGQKVTIGGLLAVIAAPGENVEEIRRNARNSPPEEAAVVASAAISKAPPRPGVEAAHPQMEPQRAAAREERPQVPSQPGEPAPQATPLGDGGRIRISPLARRIAADKGVDVGQIKGSGPGGRIVERDVLEAVAIRGRLSSAEQPKPSAGAPQTPKPFAPILPRGQKQVMPMTKMRSAIATALLRSKQIVPHYYEVIDVDMDAVLALRERLNEVLEKENVRLSIADFVMKATCAALLRNSALNARFNSERGEITRYGDVNLGIAVAIPDGLIVPVLRGADQMGLRDLRVRSVDLIERARAQRLRKEEQTESTFTVTSLGSHGVRQFNAIINPPEVGILAVGAAQQRPAVRDGQVVPRTMMTLTLSADHRVVDGAVAAEFLTTIKDVLEEPGMMLL